MQNYDFAFVVDADPLDEHFEDRLIDAGCDDATFALQRGSMFVSFDRDAASYKEAVLSAYEAIKAAGHSILRFDPDYLVTKAEIAARVGQSRAAIDHYAKGVRLSGFPAPKARIKSHHPLWDWVDVSRWMFDHEIIGSDVVIQALVSRIINVGVQLVEVNPEADYDVRQLLDKVVD